MLEQLLCQPLGISHRKQEEYAVPQPF
jgi:hypothetical protein